MTFQWMASHRVTRLVERLAWAMVAGGLALVVTPARVPPVAVLPAAATLDSVSMPVGAAPSASWLDANPFSPSRRAPARRWLADDTSGAEADAGIAASVPDVPRLFGTMVGNEESAALLRLDAAQSVARLYKEGESGGAYRVRRILDDRVILDGPSGRIELRLRRGEARP